MAIEHKNITPEEINKILSYSEGHFGDLKAKTISPAKITKSLSAFANSEGGEIYLGIREDTNTGDRYWEGFSNEEAANGHIQAFEQVFPLGGDVSYTFLKAATASGLVMKIEIHKTKDVKHATDGIPYVRRGAQNLPVMDDESIRILERNKGITSFENETVQAPIEVITESESIESYLGEYNLSLNTQNASNI